MDITEVDIRTYEDMSDPTPDPAPGLKKYVILWRERDVDKNGMVRPLAIERMPEDEESYPGEEQDLHSARWFA